MHDRVVVSDASTIIGLISIEYLEILKELYESIEITTIVKNEVGVFLPDWIKVNDSYNEDVYNILRPKLDDGEASSIALALEYNSTLLIIDERKGRKQAQLMGLKITGLLGVIIKAKEKGLVSSGKKLIDRLIDQGFRISKKIYELALLKMNE